MRGRLFQGEPAEIEVGDSVWQRDSTWESGAKRSSELGVLNHSIHIYISIIDYIALFFLSFLYLSCGGAKFIRYGNIQDWTTITLHLSRFCSGQMCSQSELNVNSPGSHNAGFIVQIHAHHAISLDFISDTGLYPPNSHE